MYKVGKNTNGLLEAQNTHFAAEVAAKLKKLNPQGSIRKDPFPWGKVVRKGVQVRIKDSCGEIRRVILTYGGFCKRRDLGTLEPFYPDYVRDREAFAENLFNVFYNARQDTYAIRGKCKSYSSQEELLQDLEALYEASPWLRGPK